MLAGATFGPSLISQWVIRQRDREDARLEEIRSGLLRSIERTQVIPGPAEWVAAVEAETRLNRTEVEHVFPECAANSPTRRVLLLDPGLGATTLPYTQSVASLVGPSAELLGSSARMLLVSSAKKGLPLPLTSGLASEADFEALWEGAGRGTTNAVPADWPANWSGNGAFLHVARITLANLFHDIDLENLGLGLDQVPLLRVEGAVHIPLLKGTLLRIHDLSGTLLQARVVRHPEAFRLASVLTGRDFFLMPANVAFSSNGSPWFPFGKLLNWIVWVINLLGNWWTLNWDDTNVRNVLNGLPVSVLFKDPPTTDVLLNYDPSRDSAPGLVLAKGGSGPSESNATKVQKWITDTGSINIDGRVVLTLFSALKDFNTTKKGEFTAYLVECNAVGGSPTTLATVTVARSVWDGAGTGSWIPEQLDFGVIQRSISSSKRLGVVVVVGPSSGDSMWFAYGTASYPGRVTLVEE